MANGAPRSTRIVKRKYLNTMIKYIFKQIWALRRQNSWIVLELVVVFLFLLLFSDLLLIRAKTYFEPVGFDIENTFTLSLKQLESIAPGYIAPEENQQTPMDELSKLVGRIEVYPDIESLSLSYHSLPYSLGGVWNSLRVDSTYTKTIRVRAVTPSYFDVFRIHTFNNQPVRIESAGQNQIILSKDIAEYLFGSAEQAIGKTVYGDETDDSPLQVISVSALSKRKEFNPYEGNFYLILTMPMLNEWLKTNNVTGVNICVRVRPGSARHFEENFITDMGDRLKENNLYVSALVPSSQLRDNVVGKQIRIEILPMIYVIIFVLITVFLGVFGTFWLHTRQRRSEIGIRMAMGASRRTIWNSMVLEGLCMMAIAILPGLLVYVNLLNADALDTWRLPFTFGRVLIAFGCALLIIIVIIVGGTSWPANRAASIQPVDALHDE